MNSSLNEFCLQKINEYADVGLNRQLHATRPIDARRILWNGRECLDFSSNDYLGLARRENSQSKSVLHHSGAGSSRLISGNHGEYELLEAELAAFKQTEMALVFTSGYAAAMGTIPAVVGKEDFIVMDKLSHACLVDGSRLSGATLRVFPHNHLRRCEELLSTCRKSAGKNGKILLLTESVFSMDGDLAPLDELVALKKKYGAWLMVDEAHGTGVLGHHGRGGAEHFGVEGEIDISMGTLSKAVGCVGGFIAGSRALREFLVHSSRTLIFSTGLPPSICHQVRENLRLIRNDPTRRSRLREHVRHFSSLVKNPCETPLFPILIGDESRVMEVRDRLLDLGIFVPAVRYPTVGRGRARLRVSLNSGLESSDLERLYQVLQGEAAVR